MRRYLHVLLGGLFIGVLSSLPFVGAANLCCCLWVVLGGILTAYLQQQDRDVPVESGEAAVGGLLAGLLGGALQVALMVLMFAVSGGAVDSEIQARLEESAQLPPEVRERILEALSGPGVLVLMGAVVLPVYGVVGSLGALLGRAIFKKKAPPAPPATEA